MKNKFICQYKGIHIYYRELKEKESKMTIGNPRFIYEAQRGMFGVQDKNIEKVKEFIDKGYLD